MRGVLVGLVLGIMTMLVGSAARADERIGLSNDGVTWGEQLDAPLFDSDVRWVPGDVRSASFFVRNQAGSAAELAVDLRGTDVVGLLDTGDLTVTALGGGGSWRSTDEPGIHRLVSAVDVGVADSERVDVRVALAAEATNDSEHRSFELNLRVHLQQSTHGEPGGTKDEPHGFLPGTGGPGVWTIAIGLILTSFGVAILSQRAQRADRHG